MKNDNHDDRGPIPTRTDRSDMIGKAGTDHRRIRWLQPVSMWVVTTVVTPSERKSVNGKVGEGQRSNYVEGQAFGGLPHYAKGSSCREGQAGQRAISGYIATQ
jgi:hypothetical protein